jgi:hypothetical protein
MMVNIVYMILGCVIGFLVKHEIDLRSRKKRVEKRLKVFSNVNVDKYNDTIKMVKELNQSLSVLQQQKKEGF